MSEINDTVSMQDDKPTVIDAKFINAVVNVDGNNYVKCVFENATLVYRGGDFPAFNHCGFTGKTVWRFDGPAMNTINFARSLHGIPQFQPAAEAVISAIRSEDKASESKL